MYGMINVAIKELVVTKFGKQKWNEICEEVKLEDDMFQDLQYYPDHTTYQLVAAASKILSLAPDLILKEFGTYWIQYTADVGYGPIMDLFGGDFSSCLKNLNNMHARMGLNMPNLKPPRFELQEIDKSNFVLEYYSSRKGLDSMVTGMILGLATKFKIRAEIKNLSEDSNQNPQKFQITICN